MNSSAATLYSIYKDAGVSWPLVLSALGPNLVGIPGMFLNFALIWVTYRTKKLHGTANYLLALYSCFEMLHEHSHLLFLYMAISGRNFLPYYIAVRISCVGIFSLGGVAPSMLFTGLDRLFSVLFPIFPNFIRPKVYLTSVTAICLICSSLMLFITLNNDLPADTMITGYMGDMVLLGRSGQIYSNCSFALNNLTIAIYVIVGLLVRFRSVSTSTTNEIKNRRLLRSLFAIIGVNVGGYYLMRIYAIFLMPYIPSAVLAWFLKQPIGVVLNISAASNAPILYMTSKDYRRAFKHHFSLYSQFLGIGTADKKTKTIVTMTVKAKQPPHHHPNGIVSNVAT